MNKIHPSACVSPNAKIGENVEIGPMAVIADKVEIGDGTKIHSHAVIYDFVKIGKNCQVFPGAVIGAVPQDLKFTGEETYVEIGDNVTIRECVTINRGTSASGKYKTVVGNDCLIMSYVHIAHDCEIGNNCILVSYVGLAGETVVDDWAIIGGGSKAHQFTKIGEHAMIAGMSKLNKDVPPYVLCGRDPICYCGLNLVGLKRRGFTNDDISTIKDIYDTIYNKGYNIKEACLRVETDFPQSEMRDKILNFIKNSKRGIFKGAESTNVGGFE